MAKTPTKLIAPLRRRLVAGVLQVRTVFTQCFPIGHQLNDNSKAPKKRKIDEHDNGPEMTNDDSKDKGRTCAIPLIDSDPDELSTTLTMSDASSTPTSSPLSPLSCMNDETDAKPVNMATAVVEPLRPRRGLASRVNRTFLLRKAKAALYKVKQASEQNKPPQQPKKQPVFTRPTNHSKTPPNASSKHSASSSSRPHFSGGKAALSGCLMTFVIFTNGSSTRMWFLVSGQPQQEQQHSKAKKAKSSSTSPRNQSTSPNPQESESRRPHSSTSNSSRRANNVPTSRPQTTSGDGSKEAKQLQNEKKRSLINRFLCSEDDSKCCTGIEGRSRLAIAASWACPAAIKLLLKRGAPVNSVDCRGKAALHYVAYGHSSVDAVVECLLLLLDAGATVNCFDDEQNTPLHLAALAGCGPAMGLLLSRGADSTVPNASGRTPVFNFLNNAFNAENIPALLELANGSPYAFAGAFQLSEKMKASLSSYESLETRHHLSTAALFESAPSKKLIDCTGRMPLVLKLTIQPSLMPVHVDETSVLSPQFKELLCLFVTCPPSLQLLAIHSIRNAVLEALNSSKNQSSSATPSTDSLRAAANVIDLPNSLKSTLFT